MDKKTYSIEIKKSYQISNKFGKGGYSSYGDRSEYLLKIIKNIKSSEEIKSFREACREFIVSGGEEKIDFIISALIDAVEFGTTVE